MARYTWLWLGVVVSVVVVLLILVEERKLLFETCQAVIVPDEPVRVKLIGVPKQTIGKFAVTEPPTANGLTVIVAVGELTFVQPLRPKTALY